MDLENLSMQIISNVGGAKSLYIMAINEAKNGNYDKAKEIIREGDEYYNKGHHAHSEIFMGEIDKDFSIAHVLLLHAEDQLMAADSFKIIANEFIDLYKKIGG